MRVVITGATGNVGLSVVKALAQDAAIDAVVGVARRAPDLTLDKVTWTMADVSRDDLSLTFRRADAVVHLAWLIQPSRDENVTWATNVVGTSNVLDAISRTASVQAVVVASSVGAYSPGPKDRAVDESWPTHGVPTSSYSRQKAYVERLLDAFEPRHPHVRVVRLRPGLIFQGQASTEIRRYFLGPLVPAGFLKPERLPLFPVIPGLSTQVVHATDMADAYCRAVKLPVRGAFNVASDPPLDMTSMAEALNARTVRLPAPLARAVAAATWRLRLQPTDAGWLDLALSAPRMDIARARTELNWTPAFSADTALRRTDRRNRIWGWWSHGTTSAGQRLWQVCRTSQWNRSTLMGRGRTSRRWLAAH